MSIESINSSISTYQKRIGELNNFISSINELKSNASKTSNLLKTTADSLAMGLTIENKSADDGKLLEISNELVTNIGKLSSAVATANNEILTLKNKISELEREKQRIIEENRRKENERNQ